MNVSLLFITAVNFCRQSWQSPCSPTFPVSRLRIDGFNTAPGLTGWVQKYSFPKAWMRSRKRAFLPPPLPVSFSFPLRGSWKTQTFNRCSIFAIIFLQQKYWARVYLTAFSNRIISNFDFTQIVKSHFNETREYPILRSYRCICEKRERYRSRRF